MEFRPGQRARLAPELGGAEVTIVDGYHASTYQVRAGGRDFEIGTNALRPATIEWRPGDVVVLRPSLMNGATTYTYVRGAVTWPGDRAAPKTDEQVNEWYKLGKLTPVLQSGGVPFDPARLPR